MRVAVLGLGSAGRRHAGLLEELGHEVVGFDPAVPAQAGTAEDAVAAADAVIVASPTALHAEHAALALDAGLPVLVEKPLAAALADGRALARRAGVSSGVAMNLRFHRGLLALKRVLDGGELGSVRYARASFGYDLRRWRPETDYRESYSARADLGGGIVLDAIHELDYLLWLLGPAESVCAEAEHVSQLEVDVEDLAAAVLRLRSGALASIDLNFFEPADRRGCLLVGDDAVAEWDWPSGTVAVRSADDESVVDVAQDVAETYRAELDDFVSAALGESAPRATFADGLAALELADALKRSAADGRRVTLG